jgi:hypothetical protein
MVDAQFKGAVDVAASFCKPETTESASGQALQKQLKKVNNNLTNT